MSVNISDFAAFLKPFEYVIFDQSKTYQTDISNRVYVVAFKKENFLQFHYFNNPAERHTFVAHELTLNGWQGIQMAILLNG